MSCQEYQGQIGAARDGELDDDSRLRLEAHLAECSECRNVAEGIDHVDALLRRSLRPMRRRSDELADRVTLELSSSLPGSATRTPVTWPRLSAATAAGFLIACLVFQPWQRPRGLDRHLPRQASGPAEERDSPASTVAVAQLMAATGPIDVRFPDQAEWITLAEVTSYQCPSDTCVKTPTGSVCELETTTGHLVRLRDETEVEVRTPDELKLNAGHVWCNVFESGRLLVTADTPGTAAAEDEATMSAEAVGPAAVQMQCVNPDPLTVTSCSGLIDVDNGTQRTTLSAGGSVQLVSGALVPSDASEAAVLSEAWMHPLIMRKGYHDEELSNRVDALLARIGDMKMALMYEQQIRGLGEYGALPLLRYVQTSSPDTSESRREEAARILADIAPVWMVPDLIELLSDDNPRIRAAGDRALVRLTGRESGMTADDWAAGQASTAAVVDWQQWWERFGEQYPLQPGAGISVDGPADQWLKARNQ